jgi:hypothetical protein
VGFCWMIMQSFYLNLCLLLWLLLLLLLFFKILSVLVPLLLLEVLIQSSLKVIVMNAESHVT